MNKFKTLEEMEEIIYDHIINLCGEGHEFFYDKSDEEVDEILKHADKDDEYFIFQMCEWGRPLPHFSLNVRKKDSSEERIFNFRMTGAIPSGFGREFIECLEEFNKGERKWLII